MNWASLGDFSSPIVQGRGVANRSFLLALSRWGGRIGKKVLFLPYPDDADLSSLGYECRLREEAKNWEFSRDWVLFQPDIAWDEVLRARERFAWQAPISAITHSLSYPHLIRRFLDGVKYIRRGDVLVCTSPTAERVMRTLLERLGVEVEIRVIPLGLPEGWRPLERNLGRKARQELGIGEDETVFLYFSRISEFSKADLFVLMRAIYHLSKVVRQRFRVIIAGGTDESDYHLWLKDLVRVWGIEKFVSIVPNPSENDKAVLFAVSDVFLAISDSFQETFGLVLLEAMDVGLPIIAFDWGGYRDVLSSYPCKRMIETKTFLGIEEEVADLEFLSYEPKLHLIWASTVFVDLEELIRAMSEAMKKGRKRCAKELEERYRWKAVIEEWQDLWEWQGTIRGEKVGKVVDREITISDIFYSIYPSKRMSTEVRYRVREDGLLKKGLGLHPWLKGIIHEDRVRRFLAGSKEGRIEEAMQDWGLSRLEVSWLIKQGWLAIG